MTSSKIRARSPLSALIKRTASSWKHITSGSESAPSEAVEAHLNSSVGNNSSIKKPQRRPTIKPKVKPIANAILDAKAFRYISPQAARDRHMTKLAIKLNKEAEEKEKADRLAGTIPSPKPKLKRAAPPKVKERPYTMSKPPASYDPDDRSFGWQYRKHCFQPRRIYLDEKPIRPRASLSEMNPAPAPEQTGVERAAPVDIINDADALIVPTLPVDASLVTEQMTKKRKVISLDEYTERRKKQRREWIIISRLSQSIRSATIP